MKVKVANPPVTNQHKLSMALFDKFFDLFCDHAAVVNDDPTSLQKDVEIVQKEVGPWVRVKGFTDFRQFFVALHVARAKKHPFSVAYIREDALEAGELVLKRTAPSIKTIKYTDTQTLSMMTLAVR